ncbi:MAG: histidinol dehydrogenase [Acidobacteriota bacterium]
MKARKRMRRIRLEKESDLARVEVFLERRRQENPGVQGRVRRTLSSVRRLGDAALVEAVRAFDWPACPGAQALKVGEEVLDRAWRACPAPVRSALARGAASIRDFHAAQRIRGMRIRKRGMRAGLRPFPLESVGLYVPGGRASYPSTLLMLAIPAQLAGVGRIAVATPAGPSSVPDGAVLAAAHLLGLSEVYALGGAAAVGAFAFGTQTVPRVDKILGPGNAYVAEAKRQVFGRVGIDAVAGPTELVILSDGTAPPSWIAADLLAQAEHDVLASAVLITTDPLEGDRVEAEMERLLDRSPRGKIQRESLKHMGTILTCAGRSLACAAARILAPEHLSVMAGSPRAWAARVPTAAAVFLGPYSPEAAGDYGAGPNHSLPTGGTARFSSPVTLWDFVRYQSFLEMDAGALRGAAPWMERLARSEGLHGHAESLSARRSP